MQSIDYPAGERMLLSTLRKISQDISGAVLVRACQSQLNDAAELPSATHATRTKEAWRVCDWVVERYLIVGPNGASAVRKAKQPTAARIYGDRQTSTSARRAREDARRPSASDDGAVFAAISTAAIFATSTARRHRARFRTLF